MEKRIPYLDLLKAVAIFLVVSCHFVLISETVAANLFLCACWAAVPVFFMVNGALLFARPLRMRKQIQKTVWVYLVLVAWKGIYLLLIPPLMGTAYPDAGAWAVLNYLFLFGELPGLINGHLWFIEALLAVYLVFPILRIVYDAEGKDGKKTGRLLLLGIALLSLFCTNGVYSLQVLIDMLGRAGLRCGLSFARIGDFQPFGKYGNMLGFFLLGALLHGHKQEKETPFLKPVAGLMMVGGLTALWGVKWFLSGRPEWDGILLPEGYRHVPVILMAVGAFVFCRDFKFGPRWPSNPVRAIASRTLGIFYIHWIIGWAFTNPLAAWLTGHGIAFGIGTNLLKNVVLLVPAWLTAWALEKIPGIRKLVVG